jgi:hypothetical protein
MRRSTLILLLLLAGVLFASWFFTYHDKVTKTRYVGYSGEASANTFLAAEMLITELGLEADSRPELVPTEWLPARYDTLIVHASEPISLGAELDTLSAWTSSGGHLVLLPARRDTEFAEILADHFGFALELVEPRDADDSEDEGDDESEGEAEDVDYIIDLDSTLMRIHPHDGVTTSATLSDEEGIVVARRAWGEGYVTVMANAWYFSNYNLEEYDHARLLMDIVAGYVESGKTWFIYNTAFPSLWELIWRNGPLVVLGFAATLLLWLWSRAPKFGPATGPDSLVRRSILEHVRAAGNFAWRNRAAADLVTSSTAAILHEAERRHPGISRLAPQAQARQLARMTGMREQYVFDALFNQDHTRHREFTRLMKVLQRIRKNL